MKIAIIGGGLAGVAAAWRLKDQEITLFDPKGIAGGPSGIAAGLLHPYAGAHSKLNWMGKEGMEATLKLIKSLEPSVAAQSGMLRLALTGWQAEDYALCAQKYPDVQWCSAEKCNELVPGTVSRPGIFISSAWTVNTKAYLEGLWKSCEGAILEKRHIESLDELSSFDQVIIANGAAASKLADIRLNPIKGQLLELEWPQDLPPLPFPVNSQAYIVMNPDKKSCIVGATFEKKFENEGPDLKTALDELRPKYVAMIPALANARIIDCRAGIRAATFDHHPVVRQVDARTWVITGLGSKGLLYHALCVDLIAIN